MRALFIAIASLCLATVASADPSTKTLDANKAVVKKFEEEFKNKANHAIVDELMAPTYKAHGLGPAPIDRAGLKQLGAMIVTAFPDVHATIESIVAEGDTVVTRCSVKGTNKGSFQGVPATNKQVQFTEMHMYKLAGGKIVEQWSNVDFLAILVQIGAVPPPKA
jgi:predicted ester cyclase